MHGFRGSFLPLGGHVFLGDLHVTRAGVHVVIRGIGSERLDGRLRFARRDHRLHRFDRHVHPAGIRRIEGDRLGFQRFHGERIVRVQRRRGFGQSAGFGRRVVVLLDFGLGGQSLDRVRRVDFGRRRRIAQPLRARLRVGNRRRRRFGRLRRSLLGGCRFDRRQRRRKRRQRDRGRPTRPRPVRRSEKARHAPPGAAGGRRRAVRTACAVARREERGEDAALVPLSGVVGLVGHRLSTVPAASRERFENWMRNTGLGRARREGPRSPVSR